MNQSEAANISASTAMEILKFERLIADIKQRHPDWFDSERTGKPQDAPEPPKGINTHQAVIRLAPPAPVNQAVVIDEGPEVVDVEDDDPAWWDL